MAGIRNTMPLQELEELNEPAYQKLLDIMATLVRHSRTCAMSSSPLRAGSCGCCRRGWASVPPPRSGSPPSSLDEGVISMDEALGCASGAGPAELMFPRFDEPVTAARLATGMGASPGAAVGRVVFDSQSAVAQAAKGEAVILVRTETNPDDLPGMVAAKGILTRRGGKISHAAVVARGMGKTLCRRGAGTAHRH
jgi:pyruvate,orthophosphate dikinase